MKLATHPESQHLENYALGKNLPPAEVDTIAEHLEKCPTCCDFVDGVRPDPFLDRLKKQARETPLDDVPLATAVGDAETCIPGAEASNPSDNSFPTIRDFTILKKLGQGGMGIVYLAWQQSLRRQVAIKLILASDSDPERMNRFVSEAEASAQLEHEHIVRVYGFGASSRGPYLVQEYVDGGPLSNRYAQSACSPREAAAIVRDAARAIHYAHKKGIIHRDLKPGNMLCTSTGVVKVADFGLAKRVDEESGRTQAGVILGTPNYMPPEQANAQTHGIGPASDIYSLGAVLYELVTGRPPFKGANVLDTLEAVRKDDPIPPRKLQPKVPRDLETICLKCLEKEPRKRYASAADLADDLDRFLRREPIRGRPIGWLGRAVRFARRKPAITALLALLFIVIVGGFTGITWQWLRADANADRERIQRQRADDTAITERKERERADTNERTAVAEYERANRYIDMASGTLSDMLVIGSGETSPERRKIAMNGLNQRLEKMIADLQARPTEMVDLETRLQLLQNIRVIARYYTKEHDDIQGALKLLDRVRELVKPLELRAATDRDVREAILDYYRRRAEALTDLNRFDEAVKQWNIALEVDQGEWRDLFRTARAIPLVLSGDYRKAITEVDEIAETITASAAVFLRASIYSLASFIVLGDNMLSRAERAKLSEQYALKAVELLESTLNSGFATYDRLTRDPKFGPLKDRADFKKLVAATKVKSPKM